MREKFPGHKVQKISINAGFSCPNRDGSIGTGGCIYCDNTSFTPTYCFSADSVARQLESGKAFFARKYPEMKYLAYFQSFSNTYGDVSRLRSLYLEAAGVEDVVGIIVGTRPDMLDDGVVEMLAELRRNTEVMVEIGAESSFDETLRLVNRGHSWSDVEEAVKRLAAVGIPVGLHLIAGLPGETREMTLQTVAKAVALPIESIKLHHLQILSGTPLERMWRSGEIEVASFTVEEYLDLCRRVVEIVPRHIAIERFLASAPPGKVVSPRWNLKNYQFVNRLNLLLGH